MTEHDISNQPCLDKILICINSQRMYSLSIPSCQEKKTYSWQIHRVMLAKFLYIYSKNYARVSNCIFYGCLINVSHKKVYVFEWKQINNHYGCCLVFRLCKKPPELTSKCSFIICMAFGTSHSGEICYQKLTWKCPWMSTPPCDRNVTLVTTSTQSCQRTKVW